MNYNRNLHLTSISHFLSTVNDEMKFHLTKQDYKSVVKAPTTGRLILIFIDMNYIYNSAWEIRRQIFEAAELFNRAGGKIFGFFKGNRITFRDVNTLAFTSLLCNEDYTPHAKASDMRSTLSHYTDCTKFVFTNQDVINELNWMRHDGDIIIDVDGTNFLQINGQVTTPRNTYTVVECILFYLGIIMSTKTLINNIPSDY